MKLSLASSVLVVAISASAANTNIYHDGWIDLNKNGTKDVFEDPTQPIERRVADLLGQMSMDEKLGQLHQSARDTGAEKIFAEQLQRAEIGSFLGGSETIETPLQGNALQRIAVEQSRLGIPLIFGHDSIHGFRTIFPIPLAMACAWDPQLFERTQRISARETAAAGTDWTFAPMVDLARDARWGRIAEGFGEDPWLGSLDAAASVRGFQGTNIADPDRIVACLKHYVGYGAAEAGRDYNTTEISEYTLRNFYLPQFHAGVDAGAWTLMSAFNCLSGYPASGNLHTLNDILRNEWKFNGFVVSDWTSVEELIDHGVASNHEDAGRIALTAGVDMEMVSSNYYTLAQQVKDGRVAQAVIDQAVRRILTVKFAKGLFDHPYADETNYKTAFLKPDALTLAREAAQRVCVLLKNKDGALPVSKSAKKIALIGPFADDAGELLGCWASRGHPEDGVSLAKGIRAKLVSHAQLTVAAGCGFFATNTDAANIDKAVAVAKKADVVILALGEPRDWSGESSSRTELDITGSQQDLLDAVAAIGKPIIVVLVNGRPLTIPRVAAKANAILEVWNPGIQGGNGVADVLFGDAEPTARLTASFPIKVGQEPLYYNHYNTGRPGLGKYKSNYLDSPNEPLYPFGFGLSYTTFEFGDVELSSAEMSATSANATLTARVQVKNTGASLGTAIAQLYIRDVASAAGPRPVRELKGFDRVKLASGESRTVEFKLDAMDLSYFDAQGRQRVEPGRFQVWIAEDSASGKPASFNLK